MELDDLKNTWDDVISHVEKQQNLTPKMIDQMTQKKYYGSLKKIAYPEIIGAIVCFISATFIGMNFSKLDTTFLQGVGITSTLLLLTLPVISLIALRQFNMIGDVNKPYSETLRKFAVQKIRFHKFPKSKCHSKLFTVGNHNYFVTEIFGGKDITGSKYFWIFSFLLAIYFCHFTQNGY